MNTYTDDTIKVSVSNTTFDVYGELDIGKKILTKFRILHGGREITSVITDLNEFVSIQLREKIYYHLLEISKVDGSQL